MRAAIIVLSLSLPLSARALEWRSELFHCAANLPDSIGWQSVEAPSVPGLTTLVVRQHVGRQTVFGINVVENLPGTNLADASVRQKLENTMRQFAYQFIGHSTVKVGGLDWLQYPVRSGSGTQQVSGVIRFASAGGYIFGITLLRGGGQDAAGDVELQRAAASFRMVSAIASAPQPAQPATTQPSAVLPSRVSPKAGPAAEEPAADSGSKLRLAWYVGGGILVLLVLIQIIGGGKSGQRS